jgi:hypothetical protein
VDAFSLVVDGKVTQVGGFDLTSVLSCHRAGVGDLRFPRRQRGLLRPSRKTIPYRDSRVRPIASCLGQTAVGWSGERMEVGGQYRVDYLMASRIRMAMTAIR